MLSQARKLDIDGTSKVKNFRPIIYASDAGMSWAVG